MEGCTVFPMFFNRDTTKSVSRPHDVFDAFMNDFFQQPLFPAWFTGNKTMQVDIRETDREYIVEADLPGVKKEQVNLEFQHDILTIAVEQNEEINLEKEGYIRKERRSGSYKRSFHFEGIDENNITAKFENGVLTIVLPKKDSGQRKRKRIPIQ